MTNKSKNLNILDNQLLDGMSLVEASAGTGKTWNICMLYLRILLEKKLKVSEILVVTFTNLATAELKERIRSRLAEMLSFLEGVQSEIDPHLNDLIHYLEENKAITREEMQEQLKQAISHFDQAAISTIHGFCQKVIQLRAFETGQPFSLNASEQINNDIISLVTHDFWRKNIASSKLDKTLARYLISKKITPETFSQFLKREIQKPLAEKRWPDNLSAVDQTKLDQIQQSYDVIQQYWEKNQNDIIQIIDNAIAQGNLNGNKYKENRTKSIRQSFNQLFQKNDPLALFSAKKEQDDFVRLDQTYLSESTKKNKITPVHPFFSQVEDWLNDRKDVFAMLEAAYLQLFFMLSDEVNEVRQKSRQNRVISFNDMLYQLYAALKESDSSDLPDAIRRMYPAALIDEFQDTDPIQFFIFNKIYQNAKNASVFFVGDPKQAIYRFRNADLHTYLKARDIVKATYSLSTNYRATPEVIHACNQLFSRNKNLFIQENLDYPLVKASDKQPAVLEDEAIPPGKTTSGMVIWRLPQNTEGNYLKRTDLKNAVAQAVADEIIRLLSNVRIAGKKLEGSDIAILVRKHQEAYDIQEVLTSKGIASVSLSPGNIWKSFEADELMLILSAIITPHHQGYLKAALSTEMLGYDAVQIEALENDSEQLDEKIEQFIGYQENWIKHGIHFVLRQIASDYQIYTKLITQPNGNRHLTNIFHLFELLNEAAQEYRLPESLLNWMQEQQKEEKRSSDDVSQIRMESDENLVRIMTIHVAKGKEFKFVFCPFLWDAKKKNNTPSLPGNEYQEANWVIDYRSHSQEALDEIKQNILLEDASEEIRIIYVALTRAIYRTYLPAGCYLDSTNLGTCLRGMLNWTLLPLDMTLKAWTDFPSGKQNDALIAQRIEIIESSLAELNLNCANIILTDLPIETPSAALLSQEKEDAIQPDLASEAAKWPNTIPAGWQIGSYSSLVYGAKQETSGNDLDEQVQHLQSVEQIETPAENELAEDDILHFPANRHAGTCLHSVFENIDFTDKNTWDDIIEDSLKRYPPYGKINPAYGLPQKQLHLMIRKMLDDVLSTPLYDGIRLNQIHPEKRLSELLFFLPVNNLTSDNLNQLLKNSPVFSASLGFQKLDGYIKGLIDLVIEHEGRFYILDWKSNLLGKLPSDYHDKSMNQAVEFHHYHLQYLLYSVALHRYLKKNLPQYRYDIHFGGVLYLFIRGIRPTWKMKNHAPCGVFYRSASELKQDLNALDKLIGQGEAK